MRRIIVNRHNVAWNKRHKRQKPVFAFRKGKTAWRTNCDIDLGNGWLLVYRPDKPLKCGATIWLEQE